MHTTAFHLLEILGKAFPLLHQISEEDASAKPGPGKWSKKEILGHLIDSASNNQHKFVRTMQADQSAAFVGYDQNFWVEAQQYNQMNWLELIDLWASFNRHLAHVIRSVPVQKLENTISIEGSPSFTLAFIITAYAEHLKHHLNQILPNAGFISAFENIYNT